MVICVVIDCKSDSKQGNLKQQWLIKLKRRNIQSIPVRICHAYCFG